METSGSFYRLGKSNRELEVALAMLKDDVNPLTDLILNKVKSYWIHEPMEPSSNMTVVWRVI